MHLGQPILGDLPRSEASSTGITTTTSLTDVLLPGMEITPGAGTYLAIFTTSMDAGKNEATFASIFANGVKIAASERKRQNHQANSPTFLPMATQAIVTVADGQAIDVRWRVSGSTGTADARTLTLVRIGD